MKNYKYKYVTVPVVGLKKGFLFIAHRGATFEACKEVINSEAVDGWRLKQVVVPFNEKTGVYGARSYEVIFEKEMDE